MNYKIGTDLVEIDRISRLYKNYGDKFLNKILSTGEKELFNSRKTQNRKIQFLANRFAAKEALYKALSALIESINSGNSYNSANGPGIPNFVKLSILNTPAGVPYLNLQGETKSFLDKLSKFNNTTNINVEISLSDENSYAIAFVLICFQ